MENILTNIPGIIVFKPKVFSDNRGSFYESWKNDVYQKAGIQEIFIQDDISYSVKNVIRGLHFQKGEKAQAQLVTILFGKVFDVCVDIRKNSPTFGQHISFELDYKEPLQIYMPPGIAHGFCVISEQAILHYKCTKYYAPNQEGGIIWNDKELKIDWPTDSPIISRKDSENMTFSDYRSSFLL